MVRFEAFGRRIPRRCGDEEKPVAGKPFAQPGCQDAAGNGCARAMQSQPREEAEEPDGAREGGVQKQAMVAAAHGMLAPV